MLHLLSKHQLFLIWQSGFVLTDYFNKDYLVDIHPVPKLFFMPLLRGAYAKMKNKH